MKDERAEYKKSWRRKKGRNYADKRNEGVKKYHKTVSGQMALKAANINSAAKIRGCGSKVTAGDLLQIWFKQNGYENMNVKCAHCGNIVDIWHIDHIIPIINGGEHIPENLQILCPDCHHEKTREERNVYVEQPVLFKKREEQENEHEQTKTGNMGEKNKRTAMRYEYT